MLQSVNTVLIGKTCPATYTTPDALVEGDVALFDENKKILTAKTAAESAKATYIGVCVGSENVTDNSGNVVTKKVISFGNAIQKGSTPTLVVSPFIASAEDVITITATGVAPIVGNRYVLRMVYNDIYEHPGQFTHTYEVIAKTTVIGDLITAFKNKINKSDNRRINATANAAVLTLTAMKKDDNEGIDSLNYYSQVSMDCTMYVQRTDSLLLNQPQAIAGLTIAKTQGTPGKGNAKIVRDRENAALGYKGIINRIYFPVVKPTLRTDLNAQYDTIVVDCDNKYLSNDNQYIKSTPVATELYVVKGQYIAGTAGKDSFKDMFEAFIAKA